MIVTLSTALLLAMFGPIGPDTVDIPVGSPLVDMQTWHPYTGHMQVAKIVSGTATPLFEATFTTVFQDSDGAPLMFMRTSSGPDTAVMIFDRRTLAPYAVVQRCGSVRFQGSAIEGSQCQGDKSTPIHATLKAPAFFGNAADLVVEVLPRRTDVVYRVVLWQAGDSTETHLYRTTGREDVRVGGTLYRRAWVVDDYVAGTKAPASRLWLIDKPPYMVQWIFYNVPEAGSEVRAEQSAIPDCRSGAAALVPHVHVGDTLATVLSYNVSFDAKGYDGIATHSSGTAAYVVTSPAPDSIAFDVASVADGFGEFPARVAYRPGRHVRCLNGTCQDYTDASGVLYNPVMWGDAPSTLCTGATWTVQLPMPWGVGPVGSQKVTVIRVDTTAHVAWLRRDGSGNGAFAHDDDTLTLHKGGKAYRVRIVPGAATWTGYTIFRDGVVIADELIVDRQDVLVSRTLGRIPAHERQTMLFDATPHF